MKYCFILNPAAGQREDMLRLIPAIQSEFEKTGLPFSVFVTERPHHATQITKSLADGGEPVRVIAVGGDGTLNEVVSGAVGYANVEVGCYPCGSGNDFIKCFGKREDFLDLLLAIDAVPAEVDLIRANGRYCHNLFSIGIDADVAYDIPRYRKLPLVGGAMAYHLSLAGNFFRKMGKQLTISMNGVSRSLNCLLFAVGNGRVYGGGYRATPEAILDDGLLDVVVVKTMPRFRVARVIPVYKKGGHLRDGAVSETLRDILSYERTSHIRVESDGDVVVNIDGESAKMRNIDIEVVRKAIRFLVPKRLLPGACAAAGQGAQLTALPAPRMQHDVVNI